MSERETKEWRGAICKGIFTSRWPFGKLIANQHCIQLRSILGEYVVAKEDVRSVERAGFLPWLWMGIRIRNVADGDVKFCPFPFWRRPEVLRQLKSLGYPVP